MSPATQIPIDLLVRVSVLLGTGMGTALLLHRRAASVRHLALSAALGGSLVLAVLVPWAPRLDIPVKAWTKDTPRSARALRAIRGARALPKLVKRDTPASVLATAPGTVIRDDEEGSDLAAPSSLTVFWSSTGSPLWLLAWMAGALLTLGWGASGRIGLAFMSRRSRRVTDGPWRRLVDDTAARLGTTKPIAIYVSETVGAPMTWGARRPILILPIESDTWSDDLKQSVVAHEVAHIVRNDYLLQLLAMVSCAVYWFNPLVWMTAHRMRQAAERACDDQVLKLGTEGEEYAAHLIGVARASRSLRLSGAVAIGMARPSTLEGRIVDVLDSSRARGEATSRARRTITAAAALVLVLVGGVRPVPAATPIFNTVELIPIEPTPERTVPRIAATTAPVTAVNSAQGQDSIYERSFDASRGGTLVLDMNTGGNVTVRGWDDERVVIKARLAGPSWRDVEVQAERESDGIRFTSDFTRRSRYQNNQSTSNEIEIRVPRRYDVRISSSGGSFTLIDLEGRFTGHTGGGGFVIERVKGSASLSTGGGEIRVSESDLSGTVRTGGGTVILSRVSGGLRGSSGSGPVIYGDSVVRGEGITRSEGRARGEESARSDRSARGEGRRATTDLSSVEVNGSRISVGGSTEYRAGTLNIEKAGGDIDLEAAPNGARVHTGGGRVNVGRSDGTVDASTGGGDVSVGPASGSVRAGTGAGEVRVVVDRLRSTDQVIEATSGYGRIIIELPSDFAGRLDLETAYTRTHEETARIRSDWELEREPLTDWDDRLGTPRRFLRASAVIGRGNARVVVRTVNGEIVIRRR